MPLKPAKRSVCSAFISALVFTILLLGAWITYSEGPYLAAAKPTSDIFKRLWIYTPAQEEDLNPVTSPASSHALPTVPPAALPPPPVQTPCEGCIVSNVTVMAAIMSSGQFRRKRYIYQNVFLKDNETLAVYLPPSWPLPKELVIDGVHPNATGAGLPTVSWYKRSEHVNGVLKIEYLHANSTENQPKCTQWIDRPVFLLHTPHFRNIWHILNDALMGAFQTLREERVLPLAEIDEEGNMREYLDDLEESCLRKYDVNGRHSYRPTECRARSGYINQTRCNPSKDSWCRPGLVSVNRDYKGPILLLAQHSAMPIHKWRHFFNAVTKDIRHWDDMVGMCFKELYLGRSNTLNLYFASINETTALFGTKYTLGLRKGALNAFQRLVRTAELEKRTFQGRKKSQFITWDGYNNPWMEKLRQGIGPEQKKLLNVLRRQRIKSLDADEEHPQEVKDEIKRLIQLEGELSREYLEKRLQEEGPIGDEDGNTLNTAASQDLAAVSETGQRSTASQNKLDNASDSDNNGSSDLIQDFSSRPVVTFILRNQLSRCILNEADILDYILGRYNVTVRVTTFEEPFLEMVDLMNSTDVILGMHGAGWTNGLFLKQGAAGLQLFPYNWYVFRWRRWMPIRGAAYKNIVTFVGGKYAEWGNPFADKAIVRPRDFHTLWPNLDSTKLPPYNIHPQPEWPQPEYGSAAAVWIYENTLVNMEGFAPVLDQLMAQKGIFPMRHNKNAAPN